MLASFLKVAKLLSRALRSQRWQSNENIPNNIKQQLETVNTITTYQAKLDVHKDEATNGQATAHVF